MKSLNEAIVERLCHYMNEKNLTQYKLAQLSGVPFPTVKSVMQRRTKDISLKTLILFSNGLGVTVEQFLSSDSFKFENLDIE